MGWDKNSNDFFLRPTNWFSELSHITIKRQNWQNILHRRQILKKPPIKILPYSCSWYFALQRPVYARSFAKIKENGLFAKPAFCSQNNFEEKRAPKNTFFVQVFQKALNNGLFDLFSICQRCWKLSLNRLFNTGEDLECSQWGDGLRRK